MANILIVDDKEMMRDSLQATLSRAEHEVVVCDNAIKALEQVKKFPFDVIISDLKMPQMDGLGFLDELKKNNNEVPVIMMTAFASISTAVEAMRKGAFDYIQKPFEADAVVAMIERALEHARLRQENEALRVSVEDLTSRRRMTGSSAAMTTLRSSLDRVLRRRCAD